MTIKKWIFVLITAIFMTGIIGCEEKKHDGKTWRKGGQGC